MEMMKCHCGNSTFKASTTGRILICNSCQERWLMTTEGKLQLAEDTIKDALEAIRCDKKIPCEVFTRVVGYFRPISDMNLGKQEECKERKGIKNLRFNLPDNEGQETKSTKSN